MNFVGIDFHKKYSVATAVGENGQRCREARIHGNTRDGFAGFFSSLEGPCKVVIEACWNWGYLYDVLEGLEGIEEIVLAHPYKTRVIAEAQVKTDTLDARALAQLLRGNLIARAWIPSAVSRRRKQVLRQRMFWVRMQTRLRNRVHMLLDQQKHKVVLPEMHDLFGVRGMKVLRALRLTEPDQSLLQEHLKVLELLREQLHEMERLILEENTADPATLLLQSLPGMGLVLAAVVAAEIDQVGRFPSAPKLLAYAGLVPTTHASGGNVYQGRLMSMCNKWLRWAFVEAAWGAVHNSDYFAGLYQHQRHRGKGANTAIIIIARRLAEIAWKMLRERRPYQPRSFLQPFPGRSPTILVTAPAGTP
ncbi:MAG: IS110 family transposase [Verrucomicrobiae bacterium]|nr:IS110 family transposase [Verrucomicrobiae bacterium]